MFVANLEKIDWVVFSPAPHTDRHFVKNTFMSSGGPKTDILTLKSQLRCFLRSLFFLYVHILVLKGKVLYKNYLLFSAWKYNFGGNAFENIFSAFSSLVLTFPTAADLLQKQIWAVQQFGPETKVIRSKLVKQLLFTASWIGIRPR